MDRRQFTAAVIGAAAAPFVPGIARAADNPIRIGLGMAQTGLLAANGKSALLAMNIWKDDINAKGGLLGRPVELVVYDDQSQPSVVPGIYTKLLDVDKVDLVVSGYGTNVIAPAMPIIIQHNRTFLSLFGLAVNAQFHYPKYFTITPTGPDPTISSTIGFFEVGETQNPKPQTLAIVAADAEYPRASAEGVRTNAKKFGWKIVYDKTYPPATADYSPVIRAVQATNPDAVFVASYPLDSVGIVHAANELGLKTKLFGGGMVGLQTTSVKQELGPQLNGIVNYDFWVPAPTMQFPGVIDFLKKYQEKAKASGVDPLGYYLAPWAYSYMTVLADAVTGAGGLDQDKIADWLRTHTFKTVMGDIAFGPDGELSVSHSLMVQYQHLKGNSLDQFDTGKQPVILWPAKYADGKALYPYTEAKN
jgi:branched-chain amino acid transport system substrate-binding protein